MKHSWLGRLGSRELCRDGAILRRFDAIVPRSARTTPRSCCCSETAMNGRTRSRFTSSSVVVVVRRTHPELQLTDTCRPTSTSQVGTGVAAERGILLKGADVLETARKVGVFSVNYAGSGVGPCSSHGHGHVTTAVGLLSYFFLMARARRGI